jgi:hypothetical protein
MKSFLAALIVLTGLGFAQQGGQADPKTPPEDRSRPPEDQSGNKSPAAILRRLEAVTWDPLESKLIWCVSVWDLGSDMSKPTGLERYTIHVNDGVIERDGVQRPFAVPGADLHALMDIISSYAMRSTVWWGHGGADGKQTPGLAPDGTNGTKDKTKGDGQDDKPKPLPAGKSIAALPGLEQPDTPSTHPVAVAH